MEREKILTFDIYGKYHLQVVRTGDDWMMYRLRDDRRMPYFNFAIPPHLLENEIATYLDDMLHEGSGPGDSVRLISKTG